MRRFSRARVINDIECIVKSPAAGLARHKWEAAGVDCVLDRHSYFGELYSFDVEVLRLHAKAPPRAKWQLYLVTEFWRNEAGETVRMAKWLKLTAGKRADVMRWITENRERVLHEK
jgi:hypothetical protein